MKLEFDRYNVRNKDGSPRYVYGNGQFLLNAVDYLMGDESLIELRQRTLTIRKLDDVRVMHERGYWQFMNIGMPVILVILFGVMQYFIRKRKYARVK